MLIVLPHTSRPGLSGGALGISSVGTGDTLLLPGTHVGTLDTTTTTTLALVSRLSIKLLNNIFIVTTRTKIQKIERNKSD